ncbi:cadherin domain-containing protein [Marinoscillum sp.]|uniref:cadherin domain-containing protein n=1 Tax=Marinoscillum sp. TaxID=2024838 RepID=UPI003BAD64F3
MKVIRKLGFLTLLIVMTGQNAFAQVDLDNGLTAHYKMEGDMTDASGNGYDGIYANGSNNYEISDRFGLFNTRRFSKGSNGSSVAAALTSSDAALRSSSFTISFWYNIVDGFDDDSGVLDLGTMIDAGTLYTISAVNEGLKFTTSDGSGNTTSMTTNSGKPGFYHMATLTYDGATLSAYLNGDLKAEQAVSQPALGSGAITVGYPFEGAIDDIRIYNRSVSAAEVDALYSEVLFPDFSVDSHSGTGSLDVVFSNETSSDASITNYAWSFGDGATSVLANPSHTYSQPGTYKVSLTVTDADNRSRTLSESSFISVAHEAVADVQLQYVEYFFDTDPGVGNGTPISFTATDAVEIVESIDLSALSAGFHQLMVRTQDDLGRWSSYFNRTFYLMDIAEGTGGTDGTVTGIEYFFDNDPGVGNGTSIDVSASDSLDLITTIDVSSLSAGFHQLVVRVKDDQGAWGTPFSRTLYIMPQPSAATTSELIVSAEYFIGDDPGVGQAMALDLSANGASIDEQLEIVVSDLVEGDYLLSIRVRDDLGKWSIAERRKFSISNGPLSQNNILTVEEDSILTFSADDFNYSSGNGSAFTRLQINLLPTYGELSLDGQLVSIDQEILVSDIERLEYFGGADFAGADSFDFTVGDASTLSVSSSTMSIEVTSVNDAPVFALSGDVNLAQDFTGTEMVTVTPGAVPANEEEQMVTYSMEPASVEFANVAIDAATGAITITSVTGAFGTQEFIVTADDGEAEHNTASSGFTLTVNPANQSPQIADQTFTLDENSAAGTSVGDVVATDPESDLITFAIRSGNDLGAFEIDESTGSMGVLDGTALDFESTPVFELEVSVSDGNSEAIGLITIELVNVNEEPVLSAGTFTVAENATTGTSLGFISAFDPENEPLTWAIVSGNSDGAFAISSEGELTVNSAEALDFETRQEFLIGVEASDGSNTGSVDITITVTDDGNLAPSLSDQTFTINENVSVGIVVATLAANDPEGDVLEYVITSGNTNDAFNLSKAGELTVATAEVIDFEINPEFTLNVTVSDGDLFTQGNVTISVVDVNEAPTIVETSFIVDEKSPGGTLVGVLEVSDPESDDLTISITNGDASGAFAIENGIELTVADASQLDFETQSTFVLTLEVSDGTLTSSGIITVSLIDIGEPLILGGVDHVGLVVYPNPTKGMLNIMGVEVEEVKIFDTSGRLVLTDTSAQVDLTNLNAGVYLIELLDKSGQVSKHRIVLKYQH